MTLGRKLARLAGLVSSLALLAGSAVSANPPKRDRYGGVKERVAEGSGYFRTLKVGNRWMLVTPDGNPFWMAGVYVVDYRDGGKTAAASFASRYGGDWEKFSTRAVRRLRAWGFNTLGEYSATHTLPVPTRCNPRGNKEKMPFVRILHPSWYSAVNLWKLAPGPVKTLVIGGVDPNIYKGPVGHLPDVFDPNFEAYALALAADPRVEDNGCPAGEELEGPQKGAPRSIQHPTLAETPWLIGTAMDDSDHLFGFGPGPGSPGRDRVLDPHIGWIVAVTRPTQQHNYEIGKPFGLKREVEYANQAVYSKFAWRDFLRGKYGSLENLNAAWGSHYSTWESDGGWPEGHGLLDENGRHPWIGRDSERLSDTAPPVAADMDAFLERFADRYFAVVAAAIRTATPNHLVLSPSMLNAHRGLSRRQILRAAGRYCDLIQVHQDPDTPALIGVTYQEAKKPLISWVGIAARADSAVDTPSDQGEVKTQGERGVRYQQLVETLFSYHVPDGPYPMVGLDWWEYMDKVDEHVNWGLVTPQENAYDGNEAVIRRGTDRWGYSTGGEERNYGDFLSSATNANLEVIRKLQDEAKKEKKRR
ncbi:MAG TPA: hypothetical protein VGQ94_06250 [Terriglobales bacterium]|nr:hypothetical protein [Terriglobales bacterium]